MAKVKLVVTSDELLALDLKSLQDIFKDVTGKDADAAWKEAALIEEILKVAEPKKAGSDEKTEKEKTFTVDKKKYKMILPKIFIPGTGELTKEEVLLNKDAQAFLVKQECVGSVIVEVN